MECGAKTKSGKPCKAPSMANGRCRIHGGKALAGAESPTFKHGRYSQYAPAQIANKLSNFDEADPLDLLPELQVQRALFAEYLERFKVGVPLTAGDIMMLMQWGSDIGRMVERITKMRNETALTGAEVAFIAARVADTVAKYIHDPDLQRQFVADLLGGVGRPASTHRSELIESGGQAAAGLAR